MEFLKCLGLLGGSLMVFVIAGGSANNEKVNIEFKNFLEYLKINFNYRHIV